MSWFLHYFVFIQGCTPYTLSWFLQCFEFVHGLHSLYTALIPGMVCIYPWPALPVHCADYYSVLYLSMACIYPWPALPVHCADSYSVLYLSVACTRREVIPGSWAECPASGTMKNSASGHLWNRERERSSQQFMTRLCYNSLLLTSHSNSTLLLLFTFIQHYSPLSSRLTALACGFHMSD